jgi:AraC-like DNA-binding protein
MTANLAELVERHIPEDGMQRTGISALNLYRSSSPSTHDAAVYEPALVVMAQGAKEVILGDDVYRYDPDHYLLVSVDLAVSARVVEASPRQPSLAIRITLDPGVVGELLADGTAVPSLGPPMRGLAVTPIDPALRDAVTRLVGLLDSPRDIAAISPLVLREIIYRILVGPQGPRLRQIVSVGAPAQRIAEAIRWLKDHVAEPLRIETLAKKVGMGPSALHLHFKNITAMSPLQYQKQLRLQEARRLMLGEGLDAAQAAFRVGYESPSQFSREYRRLFGAPPRQDVAAVRVHA